MFFMPFSSALNESAWLGHVDDNTCKDGTHKPHEDGERVQDACLIWNYMESMTWRMTQPYNFFNLLYSHYC